MSTNEAGVLPHHRYITSAQKAECEAEYQRRWQAWLEANTDEVTRQVVGCDVHRAIWQSAHGAESITVRD